MTAEIDMVSELGDEREEDGESESTVASMRKVIKAQGTVIIELQQLVDTLETKNKQLVKDNRRTQMLETENRELNRTIKKLRKKLHGRRRRMEFGGGDEEENGSQVVVKEEPSDDAVSEDDEGGTGIGGRNASTSETSGRRSLAGNADDKCRPCSVVLTRLSLEEIAKFGKVRVGKVTVLKPRQTCARKVGKSTAGKSHRLICRQWVKGHSKEKGCFRCSCGKIFQFKSSARSHIQRKNNPNLFKCTKCSKAFDRYCNLKVHYHLVHKLKFEWGKLGCGICGLNPFDTRSDLMEHRLAVHGFKA